jgi:hypothetical protein
VATREGTVRARIQWCRPSSPRSTGISLQGSARLQRTRVTAVSNAGRSTSESENVGSARHQGFEIELSRHLLSNLDGGVSFSDLTRVGGTDRHSRAEIIRLPRLASAAMTRGRARRGPGEQALVAEHDQQSGLLSGGSFTLVGLTTAYNPIGPLKVELGVTTTSWIATMSLRMATTGRGVSTS